MAISTLVAARKPGANGTRRRGQTADDELPVCVFGPGGDYRTAWLPGPIPFNGNQHAALRRVPLPPQPVSLAAVPRGVMMWWSLLAGALLAVRDEIRRHRQLRSLAAGDELPLVAIGPHGLHSYVENHDVQTKEQTNRGEALSDTATTRDPHVHPRRAAEPWLFPDVAGDGRRTRHQQNHRVRARRDAHKKGHAHAAFQQGSLFGPDTLGTVA